MYDQRRRRKHYRARSVHVVRSQPWSTKMLVHGSRTRGFIHTEIKIYIDRSRCVSLSIHVLDYMYQHVCICSRPTCKGPCANVQKIDRGTRSLAYSKSSCQHAVYTYEYVYICVQCVCVINHIHQQIEDNYNRYQPPIVLLRSCCAVATSKFEAFRCCTYSA